MLIKILSGVEDTRRRQGLRYELVHILIFSVFAVLSGADSYRKIHSFTDSRYELLNDIFGLNWKRMPAYTTVRNIIRGVSAESLENAFGEHSLQLAEDTDEISFAAFDGKVLRGSFDRFKDRKAVQCLSAFMTDSKIIIAHREIEEKTNEIPAAQELIAKLNLKGKIFTFDAMHCQEKTPEAAKESGNDAAVRVKANQKTLLNDCVKTAGTMPASDSYKELTDKTRNRTESRKAEVYEDIILSDSEKWKNVRAVVKIEREREIFDAKTKEWKTSDEISYYISTTILSAEEFCRGIRGHWEIENSDHYVRDVSMNEDSSRIRDNPHIFSRLRSFALNIMRANKVKNIARELFRNCMNIGNIFSYKGIMEN
jgi:predicted transposase YbfD/YdcC